MPTLLGQSYAYLGEPGSALNLLMAEDSGVEWLLDDIQGWGSPASTLESVSRPGANGTWSGEAYLGPRSLGFTGRVRCPSPSLLSDALDRLNDAVSLDTTRVTVAEAGRERYCYARRAPTDVAMQKVSDESWLWSFQMVADDPRKYGGAVSLSTSLASSSGGFTFPLTMPLSINATSVSGIVTIFNEGNISSPLMVRFDGLTVGPKIVHTQTGKIWSAVGSTIDTGEFWTVDMDKRQVLAQGQSSRSGSVTERNWLELLPGQNDYQFAADTYNAASLMTVSAASAWK